MHPMNAPAHDTPDRQLLFATDQNVLTAAIPGAEQDPLAHQAQLLDRELTVDHGNDYRTVVRRHGLVDHQQIAIVDTEVVHRVPSNANVEGRFPMFDQMILKAQAILGEVRCRGRESCRHRLIEDRQTPGDDTTLPK
jgi:hypothetical protein